MAYEKSSYLKKWWVKTIRERNFFGFRYWWFNWSAWILACFLLLYGVFFQTDIDNSSCLDRYNLSRGVADIDKAMEKCCSCNTPPPPPPPPPPPALPEPPPPNSKHCNTEVKSGGEGISNDNITLGTQSGMVSIKYDMSSIPDKLEVIYEGNLISSTFQINGNDNGYVGGDNRGGASGRIDFLYTFHNDQYVTIRVTGPSGTSWKYQIDCPK